MAEQEAGGRGDACHRLAPGLLRSPTIPSPGADEMMLAIIFPRAPGDYPKGIGYKSRLEGMKALIRG